MGAQAADAPRSGAAKLIGQPAPDFALKSLTGQNLRLSEFLGQVVLINFWASWNGPSRQQMPVLEKLHATYGSAGLTLLGVNVDAPEARAKAEALVRTLKLTYPVVFGGRQTVGSLYDLSRLPMTVLVDRSGVVRHIYQDYKPGAEQEHVERLRALLNE